MREPTRPGRSVATDLFPQGLRLPSSDNLIDAELAHVISTVQNAFGLPG